MTREKVDSSSIHSAGWDQTGSEVQFHARDCLTRGNKDVLRGACDCRGGEVFHYPGVPAELHSMMMSAPSVGGFFAKHVKGATNPLTGKLLYPHVKREAAKA